MSLVVTSHHLTPLSPADRTDVMDGSVTSKAFNKDTDFQPLRTQSHNGSAHPRTRPQEHPRDLHGLPYDGLGPGPSEPISHLPRVMLMV